MVTRFLVWLHSQPGRPEFRPGLAIFGSVALLMLSIDRDAFVFHMSWT